VQYELIDSLTPLSSSLAFFFFFFSFSFLFFFVRDQEIPSKPQTDETLFLYLHQLLIVIHYDDQFRMSKGVCGEISLIDKTTKGFGESLRTPRQRCRPQSASACLDELNTPSRKKEIKALFVTGEGLMDFLDFLCSFQRLVVLGKVVRHSKGMYLVSLFALLSPWEGRSVETLWS